MTEHRLLPEDPLSDVPLEQWVRCRGKIYYCDAPECLDGIEGILARAENAPFVYDRGAGLTLPEHSFFPFADVERLTASEPSEETLRTFFRLEITPWQLAEAGLYPFTEGPRGLTIGEEDILALCANIHRVDRIIIEAWNREFNGQDRQTSPFFRRGRQEDPFLQLFWHLIGSTIAWYDPEMDEPESVTDFADMYIENKGRAPEDIRTGDEIKKYIILSLQSFAEHGRATEEQKKACVKMLNDLCAKGNTWALETRARSYYGGSVLFPCDWKAAEEDLLRLEAAGNKEAANALGYIYYSDRLGQPDYDKAFHYFSIASRERNIEARYKLADMHRKGHGTAKDPEKGFAMLQRAYVTQINKMQEADFSCKYADVALRMGYCCEEGCGCPQDFGKALEYFRRAEYAIDKRIGTEPGFGDKKVRENILAAIERVRDKAPDKEFDMTDITEHKMVNILEDFFRYTAEEAGNGLKYEEIPPDFAPDGEEPETETAGGEEAAAEEDFRKDELRKEDFDLEKALEVFRRKKKEYLEKQGKDDKTE